MRDVLTELLDQLRLERIEETIFRGQSQDLGWGQVFGGQVLGQALSAAEQTVPTERACHSFHGYFLRSGDVSRPIVYTVDPIRDGGSFTTRRVVAFQERGEDGRSALPEGGPPPSTDELQAIFSLSASFQVAEGGFDHQDPMPDAPDFEGLASERALAELVADQLPARMRARAVADRPIEIRPVAPVDPVNPTRTPPHKQAWFRTSGPLPDSPAVHRYLLAYASDFQFLLTSLLPHGVSWLTPGIQVASLDHAMWFHRPFRFDDWLLYDIDSPSASSARGLVRGRFFDRQGRLVASTAQEGLIRDRRPKEPSKESP